MSERVLLDPGTAVVRHHVSFMLPLCPPSVNSLYNINYKEPDKNKRVTLKDECRAWKSGGTIAGYGYFGGAKLAIPRFHIAEDSILRVDRTYCYPWFTKTKKWVRRDSFNMDKLLFDAISEKIGVDDSRFKLGMMRSINTPQEKTEVILIEIPVSEWAQWLD